MKNYILLAACILLCLVGCGISNTKVIKSTKSSLHIGGSKDKHGCYITAGYTWSSLKQACIRPFEVGIPLASIDQSASYKTAAYIIIDMVEKKAEIYVPNEQNSIMLHQNKKSEFTNKRYALYQKDENWILSFDGKVIYQEQK